MSSHLHHTQELLLSTSISNDRKSAIKCCLLRAGHVFGNCAAVKPLSKNAGRLEANLQLVLLLKPEKVVYLQNMYSYLKTANWDLLHLCRDPLPGIKKHHPSNKQNILKAEGKSLGIRQQLHSCWSIGHSAGSGTDFSLMDQYFLNVSMPTPPSFTLHTAPHCSCALLWTIPFGHL